MATSVCLKTVARDLFSAGVHAVTPKSAVSRVLGRTSKDVLNIPAEFCNQEGAFHFQMQNNVKIVGFGKAVYSMALGAVDVIGDHMTQAAVCSVPHGIEKTSQHSLDANIILHHGAVNNLPDDDAARAAREVVNVTRSCAAGDLLLVLISGGGSALLPMPIEGITLDEKRQTTQLLARAGADITQLNIVRQHLSGLKAGGLARMAQPAKVLSLILSDVLDDRLDIIAGGPTCQPLSTLEDCRKICASLGVESQLPPAVLRHLHKHADSRVDSALSAFPEDNVSNVVVGGNRIAVDAAVAEASKHVDITSHRYGVTGDADELGCFYGRWMQLAHKAYQGCGTSLGNLHEWIMSRLDDETVAERMVEACENKQSFCFIAGAEPTVNVRGSGIGGRSQQLALRSALELAVRSREVGHEKFTGAVSGVLFAGGTDGIDGPTDACGAMAHCNTIVADEHMKEAVVALLDNDAYTFFKSHGKEDLVICGPTGTNVADLHILLLRP